MSDGEAEQWSRLALLADPVRRSIYDLLADDVELTREQIAQGAGISASLASHHLAKLSAAAIVERRQGVSSGREGRPPSSFRRGPAVQLPDRRPGLLADLLSAGRPDPRLVQRAARQHGAAVTPAHGATRARARQAMELLGFAPTASRGALDSGNCPFVARELRHPEAACDVALGLAAGIADELDDVQVERVEPGACCVRLLLPGKSGR